MHFRPSQDRYRLTTLAKTAQTPIPSSKTLVLVQSSLEGLVRLGGLATLGLCVTKTLLGVCSSVRVEAEQDLLVVERVLLLDNGALGNGTTLDRAEHALHLGAVDELVEVWVGDAVRRDEEVTLELRRLGGAAVDRVKSREGGRGPDDEAAEVATRSELEEVKGVDVAGLDTRNVAESTGELLAILGRVVDDKRATALLVAPVPQLTLASAELARVLDLGEVSASTDRVQKSDGGGSLFDGGVGESSAGDNERDLGYGGDVVAAGKEKSSAGRGSNGGSSGETPDEQLGSRTSIIELELCSLLAKVDLLVPFPPDLGRCEHATRAAHVAVGGLTGAVRSTTRDTRDTGDSATCHASSVLSI